MVSDWNAVDFNILLLLLLLTFAKYIVLPILAIATAFVKPDAGLSTSAASVEPQLIRNSFYDIVPAISIPYNIWVLPFISKVILISYIVSLLYSFINSYVLYEYTIYISLYKHYVNILLVYLQLFYNCFVTIYFYLINIIQSEVRQICQFNLYWLS